MRSLPESSTSSVPSGANVMPCGKLSCPGPEPLLPKMSIGVPVGENAAIWLFSRLATKMSPVTGWIARSHAKLIAPLCETLPRKPKLAAPVPFAFMYSTRWFQ